MGKKKQNWLKKVLINLIRFYQRLPGSFHYNCRFQLTCSQYTLEAIQEYGVPKGILKGIWRLARCNPLFKGSYDPVKK